MKEVIIIEPKCTLEKYTLEQARKSRGLTQEEAALELGVSACTLLNWEKGYKFPNVKRIKQIEELYGYEYKQLIFLP